MSKVLNAITARDAHIRSLRAVVCLQLIGLLLLYYAWHSARSEITVYIPPDLSHAVTQRANHVPAQSVYAFALMAFQTLNLWRGESGEDYGRQIQQYHCYYTPRFRSWLEDSLRQKRIRGELSRSRALFPLLAYSATTVRGIGDGSWKVQLDMGLREWVQKRRVKDTQVRYLLRVVPFDVSRQCNPWGLALDSHLQSPQRIDAR